MPSDEPNELERLVDRLPLGWSRHEIGGRAWGISRVDRADGRVTAIEGEALGGPADGGADRISANVWRTSGGTELRPCEMPAADVLAVLRAIPDPS